VKIQFAPNFFPGPEVKMIRFGISVLVSSLSIGCLFLRANEPVTAWKGITCVNVAFSGNGKWLAAAGTVPVDVKTVRTIADALKPTDGLIKVWEVGSGQQVFNQVDREKKPACMAISPGGPFLAVGYEERELTFSGPAKNSCPLIVWDIAQKKKSLTLPSAQKYEAVAFSSNGKWLASAAMLAGEKNTLLSLWEMPSGRERRQWKLGRKEWFFIDVLAFSADNKHLAFGSDGSVGQKKGATKGAVGVVNIESGEIVNRFSDFLYRVNSIAFSADGNYLACGTDANVRLYHWPKKKLASEFKAHADGVGAIAFSRNSKVLFTVGQESHKGGDLTLQDLLKGANCAWKAWEIPEGRLLLSENTGGGGARRLALSPEGATLATGGRNEVRLWKVPAKLLKEKKRREKKVSGPFSE
jgi:WD40 repeat protein